MEDLKKELNLMYDEHADVLFRYCYFKLSDREKAKDVVQDIFIKTWQYMAQGNTIEMAKPFLYTTARHLIIDEYRKKKSVSLETITEAGFEPTVEIQKGLEVQGDVSQIMKCVQSLPKQYHEVIMMRYVDDMSVKDIAKTLDETENVVSVRIYRALAKLRKTLEPTL
jgi:RNA polymerase sigma-70 factor (ECF subfamily)